MSLVRKITKSSWRMDKRWKVSFECYKGCCKPSETDRACLVREIKEELSIDICVGELCTEVVHDYGPFAINLVAYYCTVSGGEIALTVHDMYQWVKVEDLLDYNLLPADIQIAKAVKEHSKDHLYPS